MTEKRTYSYSQCDTFQCCHRKWKWQYIDDLVRKEKAAPLRTGNFTHIFTDLYTSGTMQLEHIEAIPDALREMYPHEPEEELLFTADEVQRLMRGYIDKWDGDEIQIVSPEMHLVWEGPDYDVYTRLDALAEDLVGKWRLERKTSSRADSNYLKGMKRGLQSAIAHWLIQDLMPEMKIRGTVFDLIVKTKVPQFYRSMIAIPQWKIDFAKQTVQGIHEDILAERFYPSLDCDKYFKECEYALLCRHDSPENRELFFESRKEVKQRESEVLKKYFGK